VLDLDNTLWGGTLCEDEKYGRILLSDEENCMVAHFYEEMGFDCLPADEEDMPGGRLYAAKPVY
jgi:hypothetical protein